MGILEPDLYMCSSSSFKLEDGDKMFLYTDGITERRNLSNKELELDGLKMIIVDGIERGLSGKKLLTYVLSKVDEFAEGVPPKDDYTLLLVEKIKH